MRLTLVRATSPQLDVILVEFSTSWFGSLQRNCEQVLTYVVGGYLAWSVVCLQGTCLEWRANSVQECTCKIQHPWFLEKCKFGCSSCANANSHMHSYWVLRARLWSRTLPWLSIAMFQAVLMPHQTIWHPQICQVYYAFEPSPDVSILIQQSLKMSALAALRFARCCDMTGKNIMKYNSSRFIIIVHLLLHQLKYDNLFLTADLSHVYGQWYLIFLYLTQNNLKIRWTLPDEKHFFW